MPHDPVNVTLGNRLKPPPPNVIAGLLGINSLTIDWLAGDGSDRCYFRIRSSELAKSYVLMQLSGTDMENLRSGRYDWIEISELLLNSEVLAPKLISVIKECGALIIEDYGDEMLETVALREHRKGNISAVLPLYRQCFQILSRFLALRPAGNPTWARRSFDEDRFVWELEFFVAKYLQGVCHRSFTDVEKGAFRRDASMLAKSLSSGSNYFVHRDFHSRNVMVQDGKAAIIDFQDARLGPCSYDLVSLCFDSYIPFTSTQRKALLDEGTEVISSDHGSALADEISQQWKALLLQRQLKAIGSFGYLTIDKNKGDYLKNVGPALCTLLDAGLNDGRWPFLSGPLLEILEKSLPSACATPVRTGSYGYSIVKSASGRP